MFVKYSAKQKNNEIYYKEVDEGIKKFKDFIYENLPDDESRNSNCEIEASYLSHGIWSKLMKNKSNESNPYSSNFFIWNNTNDESKSLCFHFDIMNNPKKYRNNIYSCGLFKKCNEIDRQEIERIYHSIGNISPIPWFKLSDYKFINGQLLHKSLDERWDIYLSILNQNWINWSNPNCSLKFEDYMILTCQQMYYIDIFNDVKNKGLKEIKISTIQEYNKKIKNKQNKLINFDQIDSNEIATTIITLIKIRCRFIKIMLYEKHKSTL